MYGIDTSACFFHTFFKLCSQNEWKNHVKSGESKLSNRRYREEDEAWQRSRCDLYHTDRFDEVFQTYAKSWKLLQVKTTNMGSLFKLEYRMELKDPAPEIKEDGTYTIKVGDQEDIL